MKPKRPGVAPRPRPRPKSIAAEEVPFAGATITVHALNNGQRAVTFWSLARVIGAAPADVRGGVDLLPRRIRERRLHFLREGETTPGFPLPVLCELAALPEDLVPDSIWPIWQALRDEPEVFAEASRP